MPPRIPGRTRSTTTALALLALTTVAAAPFGWVTINSVCIIVEEGTAAPYAWIALVLIGLPFAGWCQRFLRCLLFARRRAAKTLGAKLITLRMVERNKNVSPAEVGLYRLVRSIAHRADLRAAPMVGLVPSNDINAFAIGRRDNYLIAVTVGTVSRLTADELAAVLAHEIGHVAHGDSFVKTLALAIQDSIATFLISPLAFANSLLRASPALLLLLSAGLLYGVWHGQRDLALACAVALFLPQLAWVVLLACRALIAQLDRWREFHADAAGAALTSPQSMAAALAKVAEDGSGRRVVTNPLHAPALAGFGIKDTILFAGLAGKLFATHPPIHDRVNALISGRYL